MFVTRNEYDRGVNTFSPEGRLFQVEYAIEAIKLGSTAVGVKTKEGVVLTVEKRITSPLLVRCSHAELPMEPRSIDKIAEIDRHIACANSGLTADSRMLIEHARVESQNHRFTYDEPMPVESCTQSLCDLALEFGYSGNDDGRKRMSRPFGVAFLVAGCDENGPMLYHTDPSGRYVSFEAWAIGSGSEGAQTLLQEKYSKDMTLAEAEVLAMSTLKQVMEEKVTDVNVDAACVTPEGGFKLYSRAEVADIISRI